MPCRGRAEQTVRNVKRLLATAAYNDWQLICGADDDQTVNAAIGNADLPVWRFVTPGRVGYWRTLQIATDQWPEFTHMVNLANDLLPGQHWLQRAVAAYQATFGDGPGLMGFNDGHHETEHSCHFLISRTLLDQYGGWPVWYDHTHGDTELCQRAIADGLYAKAPWATLFHSHPYFGGDNDDSVYAEGRMKVDQDAALYARRKANGWRS